MPENLLICTKQHTVYIVPIHAFMRSSGNSLHQVRGTGCRPGTTDYVNVKRLELHTSVTIFKHIMMEVILFYINHSAQAMLTCQANSFNCAVPMICRVRLHWTVQGQPSK